MGVVISSSFLHSSTFLPRIVSHLRTLYLEAFGCTSSFVFDYVARQKLGGTHMTFFILKQLPVLPPNQYKATCTWDNNVTVGEWIFPRASVK